MCHSSSRQVIRPRTWAIAKYPRVEPIALTEAKDHLRILAENAEDDAYIQALITSARSMAESRLGITWAVTQYRAKVCGCVGCACVCGCSDRGVELPNPPVLVDDEHPVTVETPEGPVAAEDFEVDRDRWPALLIPRRGWRGPATITYWAGVPAGVPMFPMLKTGCLLLIGHWYKNRESVSEIPMDVVPQAVDSLFAAESFSGRY